MYYYVHMHIRRYSRGKSRMKSESSCRLFFLIPLQHISIESTLQGIHAKMKSLRQRNFIPL